jgi:N-acetylmuramoyl-L-alanine amidase
MEPIGPGATGAAVQDVQRRLAALDLPVVAPETTGSTAFGPDTERCVRLFQRQRNLTADGIVGNDTWGALIDAGFALGDRLLYRTRPVQRGDDVRALQRSLSRLGFDTRSTDGMLGPDTADALRDFQHNAGLLADGIAGHETVQMLQSLWRRHQAATSFEVIERAMPLAGPGSLVGCRLLIDPIQRTGPVRVTAAGVDEDAIAYDIARRVVGQLTALGAHPVLSRGAGGELTASQRAGMANDLEVAAILSVGCGHLLQAAARGVSAHYFGDGTVLSTRGRQLAEAAVDAVARAGGTQSCDAHPSTSTVLRESRAPAVVVEVGFVSHVDEGTLLATPSHRHQLAVALVGALARWAAGDVQATPVG